MINLFNSKYLVYCPSTYPSFSSIILRLEPIPFCNKSYSFFNFKTFLFLLIIILSNLFSVHSKLFNLSSNIRYLLIKRFSSCSKSSSFNTLLSRKSLRHKGHVRFNRNHLKKHVWQNLCPHGVFTISFISGTL